ncbi:hypothetical protein Tco_0392755 [Tanacetum coccineum]
MEEVRIGEETNVVKLSQSTFPRSHSIQTFSPFRISLVKVRLIGETLYESARPEAIKSIIDTWRDNDLRMVILSIHGRRYDKLMLPVLLLDKTKPVHPWLYNSESIKPLPTTRVTEPSILLTQSCKAIRAFENRLISGEISSMQLNIAE